MKKLSKIINSILFAFLFFASGFSLLVSNQNNSLESKAVGEIPTYLSSMKYNLDNDGNLSPIGSQIAENETVLLNEGQIMRITLGDLNFNDSYVIFPSPLLITVDNTTKQNKEEYIVDGQIDSIECKYIDIRLNLYGETPDDEGRYVITFSYLEFSGAEFSTSTFKTFSYTFFLFKNSTYRHTSQPAVTISNVETLIAGSSAQYGRTHQFYYNNGLSSSRRLNLPTLTFDYNKFELEITKTIYNISSVVTISKNADGDIIQTGQEDIVMLSSDDNLNQAIVTFNDIGNYQITYKYIHYVDNAKYELLNLTLQTKYDRMNLFGFQIFHADINSANSNNKKEFKLFDQSNTLVAGKQTDITFSQFGDNNIVQDADSLYRISNITSNTDISFSDLSLVPSTNQAPVEFNFNASIVKDKSCFYKYERTNEQTSLWSKTNNYTGMAFTEVGVYLVKITYISSNAFNVSNEYTQWFYFEIKNNTPAFSVYNDNVSLSSNAWTNKTVYVKLDDIENPFNSAVELTVASKDFSQRNFSGEVVVGNEAVSFNANKNYKVTVKFGKNLKKQLVSYFSIDNTEISGITARASQQYGGNYIKNESIDFFSNQNLSVEWNEKSDKTNKTTAYYKYIPMVKKQTQWTTNMLETYYTQGKYIPVDYDMEYDPTKTLTKINYSNTVSLSFVPAQNILTENGMYIFYIEDLAGNYSYSAYVIDKTTPNILQKMTDTGLYITEYSSLNIIAENTTIQWGKYKVIEFSGINAKNYNTETWEPNNISNSQIDPWLKEILLKKSTYTKMMTDEDCDFKTITYNNQESLYLSSKIDTNSAIVQINGTNYSLANSSIRGGQLIDDFSYQINVMNNEVLYEDTYTFFIKDESQLKEDYSSLHSVQVSTDISKTAVSFTNEQGVIDNLVKHNYEKIDATNSKKNMYYYPINWDILQLQYLTTPTLNSIELEEILIYYYPYISNYVIFNGQSSLVQIEDGEYYALDDKLLYLGIENVSNEDDEYGLIKNNQYTLAELLDKKVLSYENFTKGKGLALARTPQIITVYSYSPAINLGTYNNGYFIYDLNATYNSEDGKYYTSEGKYSVVRSYRQMGNTEQLVGSKYDFMNREFTFFVDRQNIVSSPVSINLTLDPTQPANDVYLSRVGNSTYVEVMSGEDTRKVFTQIYRANGLNSEEALTFLFETNMLPLKVYLPLFKFGETLNNIYRTQSSIVFFENDVNSYINSNELNITLQNTRTNETISNSYSYTIEENRPMDNAQYIEIGGKYMVWKGIKNNMIELPTFSSVGTWRVTISQNNQQLKGNKPILTFNINIKIQAPQFTILDQRGNELSFDNTYYWTNSNQVRVQWTDSSDEFMAKIDKTDISCTVNGNQIAKGEIFTTSNDRTHYFDIDISSLPHNAQIVITMHYEGQASHYTQGSWQISKTIIRDRIAPISSIDKMIHSIGESSLLNNVSLRIGHNQTIGYNKTNNEGLFKNFAFPIDKSLFNELIYSNRDSNFIYYRETINKYVDSTIGEIDPADINSLTQIVNGGQFSIMSKLEDIDTWNNNKYYEIAEVDNAGNLTVYTIYFTNLTNMYFDSNNAPSTQPQNQNIITYTDDINSYSINQIELSDVNYSALITAKNTFVLNNVNAFGYPWAIMTLGNQKYVFSPYDLAQNQVIKYNASGNTKVNIQDEIKLSKQTANYLLTFKNLPCNNLSLSIAVSNNELTITYPTLENAYFTVTPTQATSSVDVNWEYVEIWEYVNNSLAKNVVYEFGNTEPNQPYYNGESFYLASIVYSEKNTVFSINNPIRGAQYRYKVVDNFGKIYTFQHLYGEEFVQQVKNYDGLSNPIIVEYEDNPTYLSHLQFEYSYYHGITDISIQVIEFDNLTGNIKTNNTYAGENVLSNLYFTKTQKGAYTTIRLNPVSTENLNGYQGGIRYFIITSTTEIERGTSSTEGLYDVETTYFLIYNLTPQINLKGKNRQDLNGLFESGDNMTSEPVTIEFANDSLSLFPVIVELVLQDGSRKVVTSGMSVADIGEYTISVSWSGAMQVYNPLMYHFKISSSAWQYYVVEVLNANGEYTEINSTGVPYTCSDNKTFYNTHYIVNADFKIRTNQTQDIKVTEETADTKNGIVTKIYEISNYDSTQSFINFFKTTIAVSILPNSNKLLNEFYYLDTSGNRINFEFSQASYIVTKEYENADSVILSWSATHKIPENTIEAEIRFGENNQIITPSNFSIANNVYSIKLTRSGVYNFLFKDKAGNVHLFNYNAQITNSTSNFELTYLNNVVFTVNDESPIQYAIYNNAVELKIPTYTLGFYDDNSKPIIQVKRNGEAYTDYTISNLERKYTFADTGLYEITWIAKKDTQEIRQEKFYFQIIRANELVWAFNIEGYENYYIKQILKNNVDITKQLVDANVGYIKTISEIVLVNGKETLVENKYLTNLFISLYDEITGAGNWNITIATGNELKQEFSYSFKINNANPPINISLEEGKSTTDEITVTFNAFNLYNEVGECIVKVGTRNIVLDDEYFQQETYQELYELKITTVGEQFVQIYTPSNRLLFTYKVTRTQPLNAVAIILIIVISLVVVAGIVIFILLRKKMKIR